MGRLILLALILATLLEPCAGAQSNAAAVGKTTAVDAKITAAAAAYGKKSYAEAEKLYKEAVSELESSADKGEKLSRTIVALGNTYFEEAKYAPAQAAFLRALPMQEKALPANSPELGTTLESIGDADRVLLKWAEAETYYKRALAIREKLPPNDDLGWTYHNLGVATYQLKRPAEAEKYFRQALAIRQKHPNDLNLAWTLYGLGDTCNALNKFDDAEKYWKLALQIRESAYGLDSPELLGLLKNLGGLYFQRRQFPFAATYYQRALAIHQKGKPSLDLAWTANCLADSLAAQNKITAAEAAYKIALTVREELAGKNSPLVAQTLDRYADLLKNTPRQAEMKEMQARASAIRVHPSSKK